METLAEQIMCKAELAATLYERLVLVVAPIDGGKTAALQEVRQRTGAPLVNLNLEISRKMLELTERQRVLELGHIVQQVIDSCDAEMILLDNIEIIFDSALRHNPLHLLQGCSRNVTIVAAWNGAVDGDFVTYAAPAHPEYGHYRIGDCLVASPKKTR